MGVKISNLPLIVTPALTDLFATVQSGVTFKVTGTQLTGLYATAGANTNITSLVGLTGYLQAPLGVKDSSGNVVVAFASVASAVNYVALQNAATLGFPAVTVAGTDPNIGINVVSKDAGIVQLASTASSPVAILSGTAYQHSTTLAFANTAGTQTVTFPDATGTVPFTGTLVAGNVVKSSSAFNIVDAGFAVLAKTTTAWGGGGVSNAFTATGIGATSIVTATILASTNAVSIVKAVPTANTLTVTFSGDPGAATQVSWIAITPAV